MSPPLQSTIPIGKLKEINMVHCDGDKANKKQLVLWKPSLAQLLEMQQSLIHGEVESENGPRTTNNLQPLTPLATLYANSSTDDPRISAPPPSPELSSTTVMI